MEDYNSESRGMCDASFVGHKALIIGGLTSSNRGKIVTIASISDELAGYVVRDEDGFLLSEHYFKTELQDLGSPEVLNVLKSDEELQNFLR